MRDISKSVFLGANQCLTKGWLLREGVELPVPDEFDRFRMEEGKLVGALARELYPEGILVGQVNYEEAVQATADLINNTPSVSVVFEAAFKAGAYRARVDLLRRAGNVWDILEVKASLEDTKKWADYVKDLAYTCLVAEKAGLAIGRACLLLMSRNFRKDMAVDMLFEELDVTSEVRAVMAESSAGWDAIEQATSDICKPEPCLKYACRKCEFFKDSCLGAEMRYPIFRLPRIGEAPTEDAIARGVREIQELDDRDPLAAKYFHIVQSTKTGELYVDNALAEVLTTIEWPVYYLDFETVQTALPLYPDVPPYEQVTTQYSVHKCNSPQDFAKPEHFEYLADPSCDCQRELTETLLACLGDTGNIMVYSHFEKTQLNALASRYPELASRIGVVIKRLVDLRVIIEENIYHPDFKGSYSIKKVLPALVPTLSYQDLDIREGGAAIAQFAKMARKEISPEAEAVIRENLLRYCERDTLAMVRLHERLLEICFPPVNQG